MDKWKLQVIKLPLIGNVVLYLRRLVYALSYYKRPAIDLLKWLHRSNETTNFTYDLDKTNKSYLAAMIGDVTGLQHDLIVGFMREIEEDNALKEHIAKGIISSKLGFMADQKVIFGRRIGWYAFIRALKPKVVVETGVDKGLGSCIITAALLRNSEEGADGQYFGTDIDPAAGYLLTGRYATKGKILYGDSIESLTRLSVPVDLFINDSDHSEEYERREYEAVGEKLSADAVVIGDNSHVTDKLFKFAMATGRTFTYFHERPVDHWYPGAGIGVAYWKRNQSRTV